MPAAVTKLKSPLIHINLKSVTPSEGSTTESGGKTVSFVACEETPVDRFDWFKWQKYKLILSHDPKHVRLDRVKSGACMFLEDHNSYDADARIGKIINASISDKKLTVEVRLNSLEAGQRFYQEVQDKTEPPKSVGAAVYETEVVESALFEQDEDGYKKMIRPATLRAIDWELMEVSTVSIPAVAGAATQETSSQHQYEMLMHGDPGMELDIPGIVVKATTEAKPKPEQGNKKPPTPKSPKNKPMTIRETLSELDHDVLVDRAVELHRLHESAKTELSETQEQLAQLSRKDTIRDKYFSLRHKAEGLLRKTKLSSVAFEKHFSDSPTDDINALCKKADSEVRLMAIEMFLEETEESAPKLPTELATDKEPLPVRQEVEKPTTPTGQSVEAYAESTIAKLFK